MGGENPREILHLGWLMNFRLVRRRHVRCDEGKPSCKNCQKRKIECEGYKDRYKFRGVHKDLAPAPATTSSRTRTRTPSPEASDFRLLRVPDTESLIFTNQQQKNYFNGWMAFVGGSTMFPTKTLVQILPQLTRQQPMIRHAALAIGAMAQHRGVLPGSSNAVSGQHYTEALTHHTKSLRLAQSLKPGQDGLLWAMLASTLHITFECLQMSRAAALRHISHGYAMTAQYYRQKSAYRRSDRLETELEQILQYLSTQSWTYGGAHTSSPPGRIAWCCRGSKRNTLAVDEMPVKFDNLTHCRQWWDTVQHYTLHHGVRINGIEVAGAPATQHNRAYKLKTIEELLPFRQYLSRWNDAFEPLLSSAVEGKEDGPDDYARAIGMQILYLTLLISVETVNYTDIYRLKKHLPTFHKVNNLAAIYLEHQEQNSYRTERFSTDNCPGWALLIATVLCRDEDAREEAIRLRQEYPHQDGLWHSKAFLAIALHSKKLEAEASSWVLSGDKEREKWMKLNIRQTVLEGEYVWITRMAQDPATLEWKFIVDKLKI
jgi:hypothetical protein